MSATRFSRLLRNRNVASAEQTPEGVLVRLKDGTEFTAPGVTAAMRKLRGARAEATQPRQTCLGSSPLGEFRVMTIRESSPDYLADGPEKVAAYWREFVATSPYYDPDKEQLVVILLNTRRKVIGHSIVALGTLDSVIVHPRDVFRPAIMGNAHGVIVGHNHPSGDPKPSEADIRVTRDLIRAGHLLKVELLDHLVMGDKEWMSLRELGYFHQ